MISSFKKLFIAGLALATGAVAGAEELAGDRFRLRGFGTFGVTWHDAEGLEFRRSAGQGRGVPAESVEIYADSLAGAQIDFRISGQFDVVVQGVARQGSDGGADLRLAQGYLRYSPDDSLVLRAGRLGYDVYLLAESRQVGFSYIPVRPSLELYGLLANDDVDGADAAFTHRIGSGLFRARVFGGAGDSESAFDDGTHSSHDTRVLGMSFDYLYRALTVRLAGVQWRYDAPPELVPLAAALRMTQLPQAVGVADDIDGSSFKARGIQLGAAYDDGPLQAQLIATHIDSDPIVAPDSDAIYGFVGYRLNSWTPFVSYARSLDAAPVRTTGLPDIPMFAPLNGAVDLIQRRTRTTQHTTSIGVRYDLSSHIDLKLQIDRVKASDSVLVFDRRPLPRSDADMTVIAVAVDFVF